MRKNIAQAIFFLTVRKSIARAILFLNSGKKQQNIFRNIVNKIIDIVEIEHDNNLNKVGIWSWAILPSGKKWPLSKWITVNTTSPYKRAYGLISKYAKTLKI